ncbi:hypothetical protein ABK040_004063 [Willaertia magna]
MFSYETSPKKKKKKLSKEEEQELPGITFNEDNKKVIIDKETNYDSKNGIFSDEGWKSRDHYFQVKKQKLIEQQHVSLNLLSSKPSIISSISTLPTNNVLASTSASSTSLALPKDINNNNNDQLVNSDCNINLFKGCTLFIDGFTEPSSIVLIPLITKYGGLYLQYFDSSVTHYLACKLANSKLKELIKKKNLFILHPQWVLDCIKNNCLISVKDYLIVDSSKNSLQLRDLSCYTKVPPPMFVVDKNNKNSNQQTTKSFIGSSSSCSGGTGNGNVLNNNILEINNKGKEEDKIIKNGNVSLNDSTNKESQVKENIKPKVTVRIKRKENKSIPSNTNERTSTILKENVRQSVTDKNANNSLNVLQKEDSIILNSSNNNLKPQQEMIPEQPQPAIIINNDKSDNENQVIRNAANDPNFISHYMNSSRLHFIGTFKNKNRNKAIQVQQANTNNLKGIYIVHIDMDSFFASVAIRDNPLLKDKPVAVSHSKDGNGDVSAANYIARKFGVKSGMWMKQARELCPDLVVMPYEFEKYEQTANQVNEILQKYCERVKVMSIDESYIEITSNDLNNKCEVSDLEEFIKKIRSEIEEITGGCTASAGMSKNQLLARLATKKAKPNGQFYLDPKEAINFIQELSLNDIPTIGRKTNRKLQELGKNNCKDLLKLTKTELQSILGNKKGETIFNYLRGIDNRDFYDDLGRKSIGIEVNWGIRFEKQQQVNDFIGKLALETSSRLKEENLKGKQIVLKVKKRKEGTEAVKYLGHGACDNFTKSVSLDYFIDDNVLIAKKVTELWKQLEIDPSDLRGIGIQIQKLNVKDRKRDKNSISLSNFFQPKETNNNNDRNDKANKMDVDTIADEGDVINPEESIVNNIIIEEEKNEQRKQLRIEEYYELDNVMKGKYKNVVSYSVLQELPLEIRKEILQDLSRQNKLETKKKTLQQKKNKDIEHKQIEKELNNKNNNVNNNKKRKQKSPENNNLLFSSESILDFEKLKEGIESWLETYYYNNDTLEMDLMNIFMEMIIQMIKQLIEEENDLFMAKRILLFLKRRLINERGNSEESGEKLFGKLMEFTQQIISNRYPKCSFTID